MWWRAFTHRADACRFIFAWLAEPNRRGPGKGDRGRLSGAPGQVGQAGSAVRGPTVWRDAPFRAPPRRRARVRPRTHSSRGGKTTMQFAGSASSLGGAPSGAAASEAHRTSPTGSVLRLLATAFFAALLGLFVLANSASASLKAAGPVDPNTQFPAWYQDNNGLALQLCLDGAPLCFAGSNFTAIHAAGGDAEAFYYSADADVGPITVHNAVEAAYVRPGPGQEAPFMRSQVSAQNGGLVAGAAYKITDPWGVMDGTADANGEIRNNA